MLNIENNPSSKNQTQKIDWRYQSLPDLVRNGTRDDFKARESLESNPKNYVIETFPKPEPNHPEEDETLKDISRGDAVSGLIDLRKNDKGKYTIWLGCNHTLLGFTAARLSDDLKVSQYIVGIKVKKDRKSGHVCVRRDIVGQSCKRTPEQIKKIIDAVDVVLRNTFK